jgi:hypothetical protein
MSSLEGQTVRERGYTLQSSLLDFGLFGLKGQTICVSVCGLQPSLLDSRLSGLRVHTAHNLTQFCVCMYLSEGKSSGRVAECTRPNPKMKRGPKRLPDW